MAKLRKMLEDVHMESEQSIHMLKKTHQQAMMELQEQISAISRWAYILCSIQLLQTELRHCVYDICLVEWKN